MRVLIAHVRYRLPGGEDSVVDSEARLLREAGHDVLLLDPSSEGFDALPVRTRASIALSAGDHRYGRSLVRQAIQDFRPDVVHFHNLYPLLGVGAMKEAARLGCAVVQTYHNYRTTCIAGTHVRGGAVCDRCTLTSRGAGVLRACYRGSVLQSGVMAASVARQADSLPEVPHLILALTRFSANRLVAAGVPAEKIIVKPNSVDEGLGGTYEERFGAVCVARLSAEKGVAPLVEVWPVEAPSLTIVGSGPDEDQVAAAARGKANVRLAGRLSGDQVRSELRSSRVCVVPSPGFEGMPLSVLEALSEGTPVAFLGVMDRIEMTGTDVSGEPTLKRLVERAVHLHEDPTVWAAESIAALERYRSTFSHAANARLLEAAYESALRVSRQST